MRGGADTIFPNCVRTFAPPVIDSGRYWGKGGSWKRLTEAADIYRGALLICFPRNSDALRFYAGRPLLAYCASEEECARQEALKALLPAGVI